jgi:hypothetical protein
MRRLCAQFAWRSDIVPLRRRLHRVLIAEPASRCWRSQASAWLRPIILVAHPTVHAGLGSATRHVRRDRDRPEILRVFEPDDRPPTQFQHRDERRRHGRCRAARMAGLRHLPCKLGSRVNPADDPTPRSAGFKAAVGDDIRGMKMIDPWALGPEICVTGADWVDDGWLVSAVGQGDQNCPDCREQSTARHSWHHRRLQDMPVQGMQVMLDLRPGRWRCRNQRCERQTFVERLPDTVAPAARRIRRVIELLSCSVAQLAGGQARCWRRVLQSRPATIRSCGS